MLSKHKKWIYKQFYITYCQNISYYTAIVDQLKLQINMGFMGIYKLFNNYFCSFLHQVQWWIDSSRDLTLQCR